jgi:hypothetical protein
MEKTRSTRRDASTCNHNHDVLAQGPCHELGDKNDTAVLLPRGIACCDVWMAQRLERVDLHLQPFRNLLGVEVFALEGAE